MVDGSTTPAAAFLACTSIYTCSVCPPSADLTSAYQNPLRLGMYTDKEPRSPGLAFGKTAAATRDGVQSCRASRTRPVAWRAYALATFPCKRGVACWRTQDVSWKLHSPGSSLRVSQASIPGFDYSVHSSTVHSSTVHSSTRRRRG